MSPEPSAPAGLPRRRRILFRLIYLVNLLVFVEVLSAAYSLSGLSPSHHLPPYAAPRAEAGYLDINEWRVEHDDWGTWHVPNAKTRHVGWCFDCTYESNSFGMRDRERTLTATSHPRWVVLGDSFSEGFAVATGEMVTGILERHMGQEFLNFSCANNFGPLQYRLVYERLAGRFEHDGVIIFLLPDNDFTDNDPDRWRGSSRRQPVYDAAGGAAYLAPVGSPTTRRHKLKWLLQWSWTYGIYLDLRLYVKRRELGDRTYVGLRDAKPAQVDQVLGSLRRIQVAASGREVRIVLIPRVQDIRAYQNREALPVAARLQAFGRENGVPVLDLLPRFAARSDYMDLYISCDGHWSPAGHNAAAEEIMAAWFQGPR